MAKKNEEEADKICNELVLNQINPIRDKYSLCNSKSVTISKLCDPVGEEQYFFKNINYFIQESPVSRFRCFCNFVLHLVKCDTNEETKIQINDVVGIELGNSGENFSKYYFVIPEHESLERAFFKEK